MMKTTLIAGLLLATAAVPLAAQDADGPGSGDRRPTFEDFDANADGSVTQDEVEAFRAGRFAEVDTDGDGTVTLEEFTARAAARATERATAMFERLDADGDGTLTRDVLEMRGGHGPMGGRMFSRLDADDDGAVSREEYDAMMERRAEMRGKHGRGGDHGHGGHRYHRN